MSSPFFYSSAAPWMEKAKVLPSTVDGCRDDIAQSENIVAQKASLNAQVVRKKPADQCQRQPRQPCYHPPQPLTAIFSSADHERIHEH
ncbi:hypothetical protein J2W43_004153 [Pseudomonas brassicacearum]|uniref:Uncharacterized protein n=1 Tax=Pseudomonas brassicacearum TaxID=930166 RepID=A0AAW8MET6_9PSED|nr:MULTISPECIES: hypothetical protein [Pseudomonas]MDR6960153.1 hypothetical protein [Pseudomonas brassicacearum]UZE17787.1 hypothetical protein LOY70_28725 [Pseudomonas sp. B21-054]